MRRYKSIGNWVGDIIDFSDEAPEGYKRITEIRETDESNKETEEAYVPLTN